MALGHRRIAGGHVVERAVRLHVAEPDPLGGGDPGQRSHLVGDEVLDLGWGHVYFPASKSRQILEPRMGADGHAVPAGQPDRVAHHRGVAGMEATRDICRGNKGHHPLVVSVAVGAVGLPDVGVQVNRHGHPACPGADTLVILAP